jgi:hypothetical protein
LLDQQYHGHGSIYWNQPPSPPGKKSKKGKRKRGKMKKKKEEKRKRMKIERKRVNGKLKGYLYKCKIGRN